MRRVIGSSIVVLFVLQCCAAFQSAAISGGIGRRAAPQSAIHRNANGEDAPKLAWHSATLLSATDVEDTSRTGTSTTKSTSELPPVLQDIVDERREFEINLGRAMDTLRKDYPHLLYRAPDFSIYHNEINVVDPTGVQLTGLNSYKQSFRFVQSVVGLFYDKDKSFISHRMIYDWARGSIRISWNAVIVPKVVGNRRNALYLDGVSMYKLDPESGKIIEHKIENLILNNTPLSPPYPTQMLLASALLGTDRRVPAGVGAGAWGINTALEQQ